MADFEHDDGTDELRSAFATFRADALEAVAPTQVDALKAAARRRQHHQRVLGGVAAVVLLLAGAGAAMVTTHTPPIGQRGVSDTSTSAERHSTAAPTPTEGSQGAPPLGGSPSASASASPPGRWNVTVAVQKSQVPLVPKDSRHYAGTLSVRLANTGSAAIPHTAVELTVPAAVSYTGSDGTTCAAGRTCKVAKLDNLAPGDTYTVHGTLVYRGGSPPAHAAVNATVQAVASGTNGTELATTSQDFTVSVGGSGTPSPTPSPSGSPSPNPAQSPTSGSDTSSGASQDGITPSD